ncbi:hypothetical protein [Clostridium botulinum]|nr:hypothetical protein [Clostridium botulinum]
MENINYKLNNQDDEDIYNRDSFTGALRYEGFSWRDAEDIANDWELHKDD